MSSTSIVKLARGLSDFESRHLQVSADAHVGIPLQIRVMREARGCSQTQLAEKIGTTQNAISRLESGNYGKPNVKTLLRLAKAFDVALLVKFVPFSRFVRALSEMSATSVVVPSFDEDEDLNEMISTPARPGLSRALKPAGSQDATGENLISAEATGTGTTFSLYDEIDDLSSRVNLTPPKRSAGIITISSRFSQEHIRV